MCTLLCHTMRTFLVYNTGSVASAFVTGQGVRRSRHVPVAGHLDKISEDILMRFILDSLSVIGHIMLPHNILG